ncbi:type I-E CRISPR-associated endoribonuclease Cas2e [Streptomyces sp. NPDC053474]|uniref:type I-E CRISPR-associated endoribonuclease Cas2e n=1 Tax=Streptomyces sp. NPDC053474 TaxID=3365704 RepID=UPI0037D74BA4
MAAMTVISATAVPDHLRGALTRWLLEVTPTLYIGTISARVRTELWKNLTDCLTDGSAVLAYPAANEQGFTLHTAGPQRRDPIDFDGLTLIAFQRTTNSQAMANPS